MTIVAHKQAAHEYLNRHFPLRGSEQMCGYVQLRDGKSVAAVAYDDFTDTNCWMHCAGEGHWLNRAFLNQAFHFPFQQAMLTRVTVWVEANNLASRRFVSHLGFEPEAVLRGAGRAGVDAHIYVLWRDACQYGRVESHDGVERWRKPVRSAGRSGSGS